MSSRGARAVACVAVVATTAAAFATTASAASLVYVKSGDIYLRKSGKTKLVKRGSYFSPSISDKGVIVAGRPQAVVRMNTRGKITAGPFKTFGKSSSISAGKASSPLNAVVSPNGRFVAYTWFDCVTRVYTWSISPCQSNPSTYSFVSFTNKPTANYEVDSSAGYDSDWVGNSTVIHAGKQSISYDVIGDRTGSRHGGLPGEDREPMWMRFAQITDETLSEPTITRRGDKLAYVVTSPSHGPELILHRIAGPPPQQFQSAGGCKVTGPGFTSVTWAPNGRSLAFASKRGIFTLKVGVLADCASLKPKLLVRGGLFPHWGR